MAPPAGHRPAMRRLRRRQHPQPIVLTWPGALEVVLTSTCDHVVLYDQPRHAICVEPQTGPPDALNHLERATLVRMGHPLVAEMSLSWTTP